jgi:23S rRNA (cytidine1920-2'-O)/16S rRNA (cytidine1409-2'-O)-methyltransferase
VVLREQTNARHLSPEDVPEACGLAVMDVSFISARTILPALSRVIAPQADVVVLVKPQFEVGRAEVGRGGLVKDPRLHARALREVADLAQAMGYGVLAAAPSPIEGAEGNREFFLHRAGASPGRQPRRASSRRRLALVAKKAFDGVRRVITPRRAGAPDLAEAGSVVRGFRGGSGSARVTVTDEATAALGARRPARRAGVRSRGGPGGRRPVVLGGDGTLPPPVASSTAPCPCWA